MATFHERFYQIYEERRKAGDGRKGFAARCDITRGQLNGWLNGSSEPSTKDLKKIATNLNVSLSWLVGASEVRVPTDGLVESCAGLTETQVEFLVGFANYMQTLKPKRK